MVAFAGQGVVRSSSSPSTSLFVAAAFALSAIIVSAAGEYSISGAVRSPRDARGAKGTICCSIV